ncbi:WXG100 family type VII secretion target [Gordonia sp. DT101]|uniref:WXG100 family type VII secretion target n=1 Tax=Gordonia sp. DT101 TaxID=3416545 RepID=UPI003CF0401A
MASSEAGGEVQASPQQIAVASSQIDGAMDELHRQFNRLVEEHDRVVGASWKGKASDYFTKGWDLWADGFKDLEGLMNDLTASLREAGQGYERAEAANTNEFDRRLRL